MTTPVLRSTQDAIGALISQHNMINRGFVQTLGAGTVVKNGSGRSSSCDGCSLDEWQIQRLGRAVAIAEAIASTSPHSGMESPAANLIVGPYATMLNRARDAINTLPPHFWQ
jgi:hypothetical protein